MVEILFTDENVVSNNITDSDIYHAIFDKVAMLHGDYGVSAIKTSFQVKVCDTSTNILVLRVSVSGRHILCSTLPFIISLEASPCALRIIYEGSSIRTIERHLIKYNLQELYYKLSIAKETDRAIIQNAICLVTGKNVANNDYYKLFALYTH